MKLKNTLVLWLCLGAGTLCAQNQLYVSPAGSSSNTGLSPASPLKSLDEARLAVRKLNSSEGVTVHFAPGVYPLQEAVVFTPEDSGTPEAPVVYRASGEVVFSGGERITGWKRHKGDIWVASLPEVAAGTWNFRQLYVAGEMAVRARTPNTGVFHVKSQPGWDSTVHYQTPSSVFEYFEGDVDPRWKEPEQGEVLLYHYWNDAHLPIAAVDAKAHTLRFQYPSNMVFRDGFEGNMARYIIENVYEALDQPGEWVLNTRTGQLFYMPRPGEDMASVEVIAPRYGEFIRVSGETTEGRYVENLRFEGLSFRYSNFVLPFGDNNDFQGANTVKACIELSGMRDCAFTNCSFTGLGTYVFDLFDGCQGNRFTHNVIEQVSAGGFRIKGVLPGGDPALRTGGNTFSDNTIAYYGRHYASAVAILMMNSDDNDITHNLIHHGNYTGISVGWSWSYMRSATRNNRIEKNYIHHIGTGGLLSDMGGIYTLGLSPGTTVRGNLMHDVDANQYGGWGIYMDEGSTSILVENNIVYRTKFGMFNIHYAKDLVVRNNIFALGKLEQISRERIDPHVSAYFEGNIVYWTEGKLLGKDWSDRPHKLYVSHFTGWVDSAKTMVCDWNLYFNPTMPVGKVDFNGHNWEQWHAMGRDEHSVYADPMFVDPERYDFRLKPGSPALKLGFRPIDMSDVGPRRLE